jgi:hypothetical protein
MTQEFRLPDGWWEREVTQEVKAAIMYFMETGLYFEDLTPTEQKRKIEEETNA